MSYVTKEQINRAKQMDLLTYLRTYEPQELVHLSGDVYTTRSHDSLKISNGKWCLWSRGIGGRSALDYLIKVRGMIFTDAVMQLDGQAAYPPPALQCEEGHNAPKELLLPEKNHANNRMISYLAGRGIHRNIIDFCIRTGRLYESRKYHNAVFVGFDRKGIPRYGMIRGTFGSRFIGDVNGSDKHYSFSISTKSNSSKLHLFESAIDLLSYCTLERMSGRDWQHEHLLSLAGIYRPKDNIEEFTLPAALEQYLKDYPEINAVALHLDNDVPGHLAAKTIQTILHSRYSVSDEPPKRGKDMNEYLKISKRQVQQR